MLINLNSKESGLVNVLKIIQVQFSPHDRLIIEKDPDLLEVSKPHRTCHITAH